MLGYLIAVCVIIVLALVGYELLRRGSGKRRVCIVVLGDIGRSPRMQYHALSLAKEGWQVDLVGYGGSMPHTDVVSNSSISLHFLSEPLSIIQKFPGLMRYVCKTVYQILHLSLVMVTLSKSSHILVQNPPAVPTLFVAFLISTVRGSKLIIDWHNYGYTILGMSLGAEHPLVQFSKWYEKFFGQLAVANLCVTKAMRVDLEKNWEISAEVLYDQPAAIFRETVLEDQHALFMSLAEDYSVFRGDGSTSSVFTEEVDGTIVLKKKRPALVVSSTSWTEDEDFSILLQALDKYEESRRIRDDLPDLICAITGKGPLKEYYQTEIFKRDWKHIQVCTPWLKAEDYPKILGSANLGVCLHKSSSGLDLPMKVVDMFGCNLPVCAVHFKCLHELVRHGDNGLIFHTYSELAVELQKLLAGFPQKEGQLHKMRKYLRSSKRLGWDQNWKRNALPLFQTYVR